MAAMDFRMIFQQENKTSKKLQLNPTLEEEINILRKKLEDIVIMENSFTSDLVVLNSRLLDEKINEYMRRAEG